MKNVDTKIKNTADEFNRLHPMKRELVNRKIALKKQSGMHLRDREMGLRGIEDMGRRQVLQDEKENGAKGIFI